MSERVPASVEYDGSEDIELDTDRVGKLVETFVFTELAAQIDLSPCSLYQGPPRDRPQ